MAIGILAAPDRRPADGYTVRVPRLQTTRAWGARDETEGLARMSAMMAMRGRSSVVIRVIGG